MKKVYSVLSLLCVCVYPGLFMYFQNVGEAKIIDVLPVTGLFVISAVLLLGIFWLILKDFNKSVGMSNITMLILINFEVLAKVYSWLPYKYIFEVISIFIVLILALIIFKRKNVATFNLILLLTFGTLIVVNTIPAIPIIMHKMTVTVDKPQVLSSINEHELNTEELPNIYYLIFDEYGGSENLKEYFEYDNISFHNDLTELNFNISMNSRNEESIETVTIVPNLLNMNYVVNDNMIADERMAYMEAPALFEVVQYLGYDIVTCSSTPFLDNSMSVKNFEEQEVFEDKAGYFVLKNSVFIHSYKEYIEAKRLSDNPDDKSYGDVLVDAIDYYGSLACENHKPQFCVGYFEMPHVPFFYKNDGSLNSPEEYENWLNKDNYIGYLEWANKKIVYLLETIISNDSNSIIIVQSDHGARYPVHVWELTGEQPYNAEEMSYQNNILNSVYFKGQTMDIEGLSGINTLRTVLNKQFSTNLEMIYYK